MDKLKRFLYLIGMNFKFPIGYCALVSVSLVFYFNFCFTQYTNLKNRNEFLEKINYTNIYQATLAITPDFNYNSIIADINFNLGTNGRILNFDRNPLYTTIKKNQTIIIRTITKEEASLYHIFDHGNKNSGAYSAIVGNKFKNDFKIGQAYDIPLGIYVHEMNKQININIIGYCNNQLLFDPGYGDLGRVDNEILIYDPDNTLPVHLNQFNTPVFKIYLYVNNDREALNILSNYCLIKFNKIQNKIDKFSAIKANLLPAYSKFMLLGILLYLVLYINLYVLFYYKKKKYIITFNICNFTKKFYILCIGVTNLVQLITGFMIGQLLWIFYCIISRSFYVHNEFIIFTLLFFIHFIIFIILSRRYPYIERTYH
ncbi:hypothetical protein [Clostridium sp. E02]|uniref:hypothetical protein n=1 Tax=Clostridium sp. E02 TaxID=2487134 RepID=UPI000F52BA98|nr:hypothetical protein [Clostridium sp. E02]